MPWTTSSPSGDFTFAVTVRVSDLGGADICPTEEIAAAVGKTLTDKLLASPFLDRYLSQMEKAELQATVTKLLLRGLPRSGYLKASIEGGAREVWLDV